MGGKKTYKNIKVATRSSKLALLQVEEFFKLLPTFEYEKQTIESYGDKHKNISLFNQPFEDFFTRELDEALIDGSCDLAVHSAKDLPYPLHPELKVVCLTEAEDNSDSLVSKDNMSFTDLPAGSRIGTSSLARRSEILKQRPDLEIVSIRGTIEERISLIQKGEVDALIVATCALVRLGLAHLAAEKLPFKTHPLQGMLVVTARKDDNRFDDLFTPHDIRKRYGRVTLAGFGPGNPELLTIAADKALGAADIIFHDDLLDRDFLAGYPAEKIYVGKRKGSHSHGQDEINDKLYRAAINGKNVVRLKGGDPMLFAHGREEIDYLRKRFIDVSVIPGISAAFAASASTGIPLTHRGLASSVAFVTAHSMVGIPDIKADTTVFYMGASRVKEIAAKLITAGHKTETPVALISNISLPRQQTIYSSLGELKTSRKIWPTPLLIIVGKVAGFEDGRNFPHTILATGTNPDDLAANGIVRHEPLVAIKPVADSEAIDSAIDKLNLFDWLVFTSRYGVRFFFEALARRKKDARSLHHLKIASVGPVTTAELETRALLPDYQSQTESAAGIISYFSKRKITAKNILLPRSDKGIETLSLELIKLGNRVYDIAVYTNSVNYDAGKKDPEGTDAIAFSSPSAVDAFHTLYGVIPGDIPLLAKGDTTLQKLKSHL